MENFSNFDSDSQSGYLEASQSNYIDSGHGGNPGYLDTANDSSPDSVVFNSTVTHPAETSADFNKTGEFVNVELGKILTILKVKSFFLHLLNWCFPIYCLVTTKPSPFFIFEKT